MLVLPLTRAAYHIAATEVLQIVGERTERRDDVVDVGDALFPFRLLALAAGKLTEIDFDCHDSHSIWLRYRPPDGNSTEKRPFLRISRAGNR